MGCWGLGFEHRNLSGGEVQPVVEVVKLPVSLHQKKVRRIAYGIIRGHV